MAALSRRSLFGMGVAAGAVAMAPRLAFAQKPSLTYEAMLMNCIDPRFSTWTWAYMGTQGWQNLYSQFTIAGGPVAAVVESDPFKTWQKAWWDNLAVSIQLHQVKRVVGLCHRPRRTRPSRPPGSARRCGPSVPRSRSATVSTANSESWA